MYRVCLSRGTCIGTNFVSRTFRVRAPYFFRGLTFAGAVALVNPGEQAGIPASLVSKPAEETLEELFARHKVGVLRQGFRVIVLAFIFSPVLFTAPIAYLISPLRDAWWSLLVWTFDYAGTSFTKLGQWMSTRPDIFHPEVCEILSRLHSTVRPHSYATTKAMVKKAFGLEINEIFSHFDEVPVASGSVGQVHRAKTLSGIEVAVKVRHPSSDMLWTDLKILQNVGFVLSKLPGMRYVSIDTALTQFSVNVAQQLDFKREARNLDQFNANFASDGGVVFPSPVRPYVDDYVMVMTYEGGIPILRFIDEYLPKQGKPALHASKEVAVNVPTGKTVAKRGMDMFLKMLFVHNFIHGDLHPGNIFIRLGTGRDGFELVILDAGLVTVLPATERRQLISLFGTIAAGDGRRGAELMLEGYQKENHCDDPEGYKKTMGDIFDPLAKMPLGEVPLGQLMKKVMDTSRHYKVMLSGGFTSLLVSVFVLEGLGRRLDPSINLLGAALPYILLDREVGGHIDWWLVVERRVVAWWQNAKDDWARWTGSKAEPAPSGA